ncbi:MAG TPA: 3-oxoacyl-[acyl-carrier-protein] synthase III C-terminal domain-containing protein [Stellaceae bacterium]|nr:3-oxoacyl-[acyl-carrier-protein] synthase III C-terminal domain-containing protein [Stellaceae bacterium]
MQTAPRIAAIATAVPPFLLDQAAVMQRARHLFAGAEDLERLLPVFANTGIRRRYSAVPLDWFEQPHHWPERNGLYLTAAVSLLEAAARQALGQANLSPADIGAIVVVSTTGIATPSLDALLIERLTLPPTVQRLPIFGLGCAGGAIGLARAATLAAAIPDKAVLFLVVELCSLTFRRDDQTKSNIVGAALFGDGAAALVLRCDGNGPAVTAGGEHTWPQTLDVMGWEVTGDGLKPIFSRDIPRLVVQRLGDAARDFLARQGLTLDDVDRFVCHPGGPKVIDACALALQTDPAALDNARAVLRDFGNMSAASVLFVLDRMLAEDGGDPCWQRALLTALGPGFTAGFVVLRRG